MARTRIEKTSFAAGEVDSSLYGRTDLKAYENGASELRNVIVGATGGASRRPGLRYVDTAVADGRLVAFEFNTEQVYLLLFTDLRMDVYKGGAKTATVETPWTLAHIRQICWTQSADTLLVVNPDIPPKKITRTSDADWAISDWSFYVGDTDAIMQPHHKFAEAETTLTPSATTGAITVTASADVFAAGHVGTRFRLAKKQIEITSVTSATVAQATVKETLTGTAATKDFEEQAFSAVRGWPVAVCFHQDRLVIGGSRDLPNRLWLSKSSDLFNFDLGEGLDDESIEFAILSDQVNAVRAVFSGRHLQVFTSGAEWMVSGEPLTPANMQLNRQTRVGSPLDRTVPPRDVDGATVFVPTGKKGLREFLYADVEQAYQATDMGAGSRHLIERPMDQDYEGADRLLYLVMNDGSLATVTVYRAEAVTAWSRQETDGQFRSVAVVGEDTYVLVQRADGVFIEAFDKTLYVDAGLTGHEEMPKSTWGGLAHLEGRTVNILADGAVHQALTVTGGTVTLNHPVNNVQVGLSYAHRIAPMPPTGQGGTPIGGARIRPVSITLRLRDTAALCLDIGRGAYPVPFKRFGGDVLDNAPPLFTGDKTVQAYGWRQAGVAPLWRIDQSDPLPFHLMSVLTEASINA